MEKLQGHHRFEKISKIKTKLWKLKENICELRNRYERTDFLKKINDLNSLNAKYLTTSTEFYMETD
jgi:hypothetical protein